MQPSSPVEAYNHWTLAGLVSMLISCKRLWVLWFQSFRKLKLQSLMLKAMHLFTHKSPGNVHRCQQKASQMYSRLQKCIQDTGVINPFDVVEEKSRCTNTVKSIFPRPWNMPQARLEIAILHKTTSRNHLTDYKQQYTPIQTSSCKKTIYNMITGVVQRQSSNQDASNALAGYGTA